MIDQIGKTSPNMFLQAFKEVMINEYKENDKFYNNYCSSKSWTEFLTELIERKVSKKLGYTAVAREYWPRVDVGFFDTVTTEDWSTWAFECAIELENNPNTWEQECNKLINVTCGLKVLIGYKYDDISKRIEKFIEIYESRKYNRVNDKWLILFGAMIWDENNDLEFTCYTFGNIIENEKVIFKNIKLEKIKIR